MPNPYANAKLYVDPTNSATQHANSIRGANPVRAAMFDKIGNNPVSMWAGVWIPAGTEAAWVDARMDKAVAQGELATFVVYAIPNTDNTGGGSASYPAYDTWIQNFIAGFQGRHAVVIYEPDAIPLLAPYTGTARTDRANAMKKAIADLARAGLTVYVDAAHDNWHAAPDMAKLLIECGVSAANGISLNVSNFRYTAGLETFGSNVITATGLPLTMVIDTSRNGLGPDPGADPHNPPGRALGNKPSVNSTNPAVDAYIWVKSPGESDLADGSWQTFDGEAAPAGTGTQAPPPGDFWPNYAYGLAKRAAWTDEPAAPATTLAKAHTVKFTSWATDTLFTRTPGATISGDDLALAATGTYPQAISPANYDLTDSHFGAALWSVPNVGNGSVSTSVQAILDTANYILFGWANGALRVEHKVAGTSTFINGPAYNPTAHKLLRIRHAAGTVHYEVSADGTSWTAGIPSVAAPIALSAVQLALMAGNWNAEPAPGSATWGPVNNFTATPTPEPAANTTTTSATITGLAPGTKYEARVRSRNAAGVSEYTAWAPFTTRPTNTTVNFAAPRTGTELSTLSYGSCISTYSGDGQNVNIIKGTATEAGAWKAKLGELGPAGWRIPLAWNGGNPGSSAGGARSFGDAGAYIQAIKDIGGTPIIAVGGTTGDNDILATDAANLVKYFNDLGGQNGGPVTRWIIGNEPDNDGTGITGYINGRSDAAGVKISDGFNAIADAMRAATTLTLSIAGPALVTYADYKEADYNAFFNACGAKVDVIDFHMYDGATPTRYTAAMDWFAAAIAARPSMAGRVKVHCGEYNWHPFYSATSTTHNASHFWTSRNTVAGALATGRVVERGGRAYQYSDNNGPLGMITPGNGNNDAPLGYRIPTPSYFGVKMWSGGNLFRRPTGAMATCSTTVPDVEVFASTGKKNVVVVNKSETAARNVVIDLAGAFDTDTYSVWQTTAGLNAADPLGPQWKDPVRIAAGTYTNRAVSFTAPPLTVTTILVGA